MGPLEISGLSLAGLYVGANLLLGVAALSLAGIRALSSALPRPFTYGHLLIIGRVLAVAALLLPAITVCGGGTHLSPVRAQVWSAASMETRSAKLPGAARLEIGLDSQQGSVRLSLAETVTLLFFTAGLLLTLLPVVAEARAIVRAVRTAHLVRRIGSVRVFISAGDPIPFAVWVPGRASIVLPAALLMRPADFRMALRHEAQHHRQGDTRFAYPVLLLRALFGLNPAMHWLVRQLSELQEYACDEIVLRGEGRCARAYCECLLRLADAAVSAKAPLLRACMASRQSFALARRMEAALARPARPLRGSAALAISVVLLAMLTGLTAAIGSPIHDRRISPADAVRLAAAVQGTSAIPLPANHAVVRQLNLLLATPDGRAFLRSSIERMRLYAPAVLAALRQNGLPRELLAIPLVESGYRNISQSNGPGAGVWQMIPSTARHYGLHVSGARDERLSVTAETAAAIRMLSDLHGRLHSWSLAVMAYNTGIARIEAGIRATHSRDPWTLYRAGFGNDPNYLARTVAVILVLANPRLLH